MSKTHNPLQQSADGFETQDLEDHQSHNASHKDSNDHADHSHDTVVAPTRVPEWLGDIVEHVFKVRKRKTTCEMELYTGAIQFISCMYVLPVVPFQMERVGYDGPSTIVATAATCAIGCIIGAILTDMPLIVAPPTSVSIFFAVSMQQSNMNFKEGNMALILSGAMLAFLGFFPPLGRFFTRMIPDPIQAAISVGIGLITALAGATEIHLVVRGKYTILDMGEITTEVVIAITALILVGTMLHFHVKGAFCIGLFVGTFLWWICSGEWPEALVEDPVGHLDSGDTKNDKLMLLVFNLFFLFILTLNGLARSLSDLAQLTKKSGAIPRGNFLFIVCGLTTMLSGYMSGPPILLSPETAAGIKAGARTGLSTLFCGVLFGISTFFAPLFAAVPAAGTAPLLIMVGVMMFGNAKRIDWADYKIAVPAYCVLFFIPFTYSILRGVIIGYIIYIMIGLFTGDMIENILDTIKFYRMPWMPKKQPMQNLEEDVDAEHGDGYHAPSEGDDSVPSSYKDPHSDTTIGRAVNRIGKFMDTFEMQEAGVTAYGLDTTAL